MPSDSPPPPPKSSESRFRNVDGVTQDDRDSPPGAQSDASRLDPAEDLQTAEQPPLFVTDNQAKTTAFTDIPPLHPDSSLPLARTWYRRHLESRRRPENTIKSYSYDLQVLEQLVGQKPLSQISGRDIARYLGDASNKATRKRRLTSARRFFEFLKERRLIVLNPTEGYFPHLIELRLPMPLFPDEQESLIAAAAGDEAWSELAIWLMLRLGLTRSELLSLRRDHIDRTDENRPVVYIYYAEITKQSKERSLVAEGRFAALYDSYLSSSGSDDVLIPVGPPAVNSMVERVRRLTDITKVVTPQVLRHSFAVDQARAGADQKRLLELLGLTDDPRNRESVNRYLRLARPANEPPSDVIA